MSATRAPVLVAVTRDGSDAAVRLGAAEAARSGRALHLLHVATADTYARQLGHDALALARTRAGGLLDPERVTVHLAVGSVVPEIAAAAGSSALLVTERSAPGTTRLPSRSVTGALAAAADVPLLSVPSGWVEDPQRHVVTTGIDVAHGQHRALRAAVVCALLRHATLRVMAVTWRPTGQGSSDLTHVARASDASIRELIGLELVAAGGDLCDVAIEVAIGRPDAVLVAASSCADLLVLGRHSPLLRAGSRLGPVARGAVAEAACPVLLTEPEPRAGGRRSTAAEPRRLVTADRDL